jgi:DegV family protein with EDD domain
VPLNVHFEGKVYKDWVDITPSEAYELFLKNPDDFGTSAPSPDDYLEGFREASRRVNNILCVTISSKLSTTNDVAQLAKKYAEKELPGVNIDVLDSNTTTAAEGFVALAAARAAEGGQDLTETARAAVEMRDKVRVLILLDTIRHVYRSGRIPKVASQAGAILSIRPMLTVNGVVQFVGVARSRKSGIDRILKTMRNKVGSKPVHVAVMHAYAAEEAERLKERVSCEFNCAELWVTEFSPIMGYACGTGTVGLAFYPED